MYINQVLEIIHTSVKIKCQVKVDKMRGKSYYWKISISKKDKGLTYSVSQVISPV